MYIKFLKSNEGKNRINRIQFLEKHSKLFNRTELVGMVWSCKIMDTTTVRRGWIKVHRKYGSDLLTMSLNQLQINK